MKREKQEGKAARRSALRRAPQSVPNASLSLRDLNNKLFFRLLQVANTLNTQATKLVDPLGITSQQWSVIGALSRYQRNGGISVNELSLYLRVSRQALSEILRRLDRQGLTMRIRGKEDSRERKVSLTAGGKKVWNRLRIIAGPFHAGALKDFSEEDRRLFLDFIIRLEHGLHGQ